MASLEVTADRRKVAECSTHENVRLSRASRGKTRSESLAVDEPIRCEQCNGDGFVCCTESSSPETGSASGIGSLDVCSGNNMREVYGVCELQPCQDVATSDVLRRMT